MRMLSGWRIFKKFQTRQSKTHLPVKMKNVNFVTQKKSTVMNLLEKREYIHSHLHHIDESLVNEVFEKMFNIIENTDSVIGYNVKTGKPLTRNSYKAELERRDAEIENGDYISHDDLKKESEDW